MFMERIECGVGESAVFLIYVRRLAFCVFIINAKKNDARICFI